MVMQAGVRRQPHVHPSAARFSSSFLSLSRLFVSASAATAADDERDRGRAPECIFDAACTPPLHFHKFALVSKLKRGIYGRLIFNFSSRWPIPSRLLMTHEIDNLRLRAMLLADTFTCGVCVRAERKLCFCSLPHFSYSMALV
jgi:hypothetical protein